MKKRANFLVSTALLILLTFLGGCGKGNESEQTSVSAQSKDYVYSFTSLDEKVSDMDVSQAIYANGQLVITSYRYEEIPLEGSEMEERGNEESGVGEELFIEESVEEEIIEDSAVTEEVEVEVTAVDEKIAVDSVIGDAVYPEDMYYEEFSQNTYFKVSKFDLEGNLVKEFEILLPTDSGVSGFCADQSGNVYILLNEYGQDPSNPEQYKEAYSLFGYSESGEEIFKVILGENSEGEEWYYVNQIVCGQDGLIYANSTKGIEVYKQDGTLSKIIESENAQDGNLFVLRDGSISLLMYGDQDMYMRTLDVEKGEFSEKITFPFNTYEYSFYAGTSSDLLLSASSGVYSYNFGEEGLQKVFDFVDSDMICDTLYSIVETEDKQLFGCYYDYELDRTKFGLFNKVDPSTIKDKKVITLACCWLDSDMRKRVVEYNKANEEYRIRVEDYSRYNTSDDYTVGQTKMNTDIASGNIPDIVVLSSDMPIESYLSKGLFADLLPFLENDPELNKEDYSENIIEIYSQDGKWYQMVPSYYLYTVFGKTSEVGTEPGWTLEDLQALRGQKGEDVAVFSELTRSGVLNYSMLFGSSQFINWETGECYFNSQEFIDLLEFISEFPETIDYEELYNDPQYWEQQETIFRDGKALLMPYSLSDFTDFVYCEQGTFGEEITAIGFPVREGVGNVIISNANYAIGAKSEYQQEAWNFLRYYLTEEYQDSIEWGWPILKSSLNKRAEAAQQLPYYIDESGNKVEYQDTYYLNDVEILLEPLTQEDCDRVLGYLESAEHVYSYDQAVLDIVTEETASYFDGQKTAEEAADVIQSRVYIYVNESR